MYGLLGSAGGRGRVKSSTEGSGVVMRNELMYLVSAISRFSRISSRSSMSNATRCVSLKVVREPHKYMQEGTTYPIENRLWMSTSILSVFPVVFNGCSSSSRRLFLFSPCLERALLPLLLPASPKLELRPIFTRWSLSCFSPHVEKPGALRALSQARSFPSHLISSHLFLYAATALNSRIILISAGRSPRTITRMVRTMIRVRALNGSEELDGRALGTRVAKL